MEGCRILEIQTEEEKAHSSYSDLNCTEPAPFHCKMLHHSALKVGFCQDGDTIVGSMLGGGTGFTTNHLKTNLVHGRHCILQCSSPKVRFL